MDWKPPATTVSMGMMIQDLKNWQLSKYDEKGFQT